MQRDAGGGRPRKDVTMQQVAAEHTLSKVPAVTLMFWIIKIAATTLGETGGDAVSKSMNLGYAVGTAIFAVIFLVAVDSVASPRSEMFYWVTIMFSQTLGTALGDWTADTVGLGYTGAAIIFGSLLALVAAAYF